MFRHKGRGRTFAHNLRLAAILSGVAGAVNMVSILSVSTLTTNVTGHFTFFTEELLAQKTTLAMISLLYIVSFFSGAFLSGLLMERVPADKYALSYLIPIVLELLILAGAGLSFIYVPQWLAHYPVLLSSALLLAMGLQNALVTKISRSVVRTTHLTGLFTDLGIELAQWCTYKEPGQKQQLKKAIGLKISIILCFLSGGILGGFLYGHMHLATLLLPAALLLFALWYDQILFRYYHLKRKLRH